MKSSMEQVPAGNVASFKGHSLGDVVRARGWVGEWTVSEIQPSENGHVRSLPFLLRSLDPASLSHSTVPPKTDLPRVKALRAITG